MIAHQVGVAEKNTCQFHIESYHKGRSAESAMREESSRLGSNFPHDIYTKLTLTPTSMPTLNMKPNTDPNPDPNFNTKRNSDHDIDPDTELDQKPNHNHKPNPNPKLNPKPTPIPNPNPNLNPKPTPVPNPNPTLTLSCCLEIFLKNFWSTSHALDIFPKLSKSALILPRHLVSLAFVFFFSL